VQEFGRDAWALASRDLDPLDAFAIAPILVEMPAPAIPHLDEPTLTHRQHRVNRSRHRVADVGRLVFDDQLWRRKASHHIGISDTIPALLRPTKFEIEPAGQPRGYGSPARRTG
jgi:hypothetical protein